MDRSIAALLMLAPSPAAQTPPHAATSSAESFPRFAARLEVVSDVDGDAVDDFLVTGSGTGVAYLISSKRDAVVRQFTVSVDRVGFLEVARATDFDADGHDDVALRGARESSFSIYSPSTGKQLGAIAGFALAPLTGVNKNERWMCAVGASGIEVKASKSNSTVWSAHTSSAGRLNSLSIVSDVDGDGADDVLCSAGGVCRLYSGRTGTVSFECGTIDGLAPARAIATGDLDGDGRDELLVAYPERAFMGRNPRIRAFSPTKHSTIFTLTPADVSAKGEDFGEELAYVGDMDGDGYGDFAIASSGGLGSTVVFVSGHARRCIKQIDYDETEVCPRTYVLRTIQDVDGDRVRELVLGVSPRPTAGSCDGVVEVRSGKTGALLRSFDERTVRRWMATTSAASTSPK